MTLDRDTEIAIQACLITIFQDTAKKIIIYPGETRAFQGWEEFVDYEIANSWQEKLRKNANFLKDDRDKWVCFDPKTKT